MSEVRTTEDYRNSLADTSNPDFFSLGYQWADKPHRHVYDLCRMVDERDAEILRLRAELAARAVPDEEVVDMLMHKIGGDSTRLFLHEFRAAGFTVIRTEVRGGTD